MKRGRGSAASWAFAVVAAGALTAEACTLVLDDGGYHVAGDGGVPSEDDGTVPIEAGSVAANPDARAPDDASGPCEAGARRCSAGGIETCVADAGWSDASLCATGTCSAGTCSGATATAPSCAAAGAGRTDCGLDGGESCCTSLEIPPGTYDRRYPDTGGTGSDPATVSGFRLDKYLVTVGRFRAFVEAWNAGQASLPEGAGKHAHLNGGRGLANSATAGSYESGWATGDGTYVVVDGGRNNLTCDSAATWTWSAGGNEKLPMNCLDWFEAYAFCIWDDGFLPSEAEWEYAAAGGPAQRAYPWGSTTPGTANAYAIYGPDASTSAAPLCYYPGPAGACMGTSGIAPVGTPTSGAALWGQLDLVGDVAVWGLDWYASFVTPCTDCAYLGATSGGRMIRGGGYKYAAFNLASALRYSFVPVQDGGVPSFSDTWGVRCARVP